MGYGNYTAKFKLRVVEVAEEEGNRAAARQFQVNESHVRYWRKQKDRLLDTKPARKAFRGPKQGKFPEVEKELLVYVEKLRNSGCAVSVEMLQFEARRIATANGVSIASFKASRGWISRFMRRNDLSIRRRTTLCQRLPTDYEEKVVSFHRHVIEKRKAMAYLLSQIGNADQTPVNFDMPPNLTVDKKGATSVTIRTAGCEKQRCTVMLAVTADGRKLPPYVVFKRKTMPKGMPKGHFQVHVRVQEKGWMNESLVQDWIKTVWGSRPGALLRLPSLLVLDSFRGHIVKSVKTTLTEMKTDLAVIPGGLTSVLQPLDVSLNKPFKDNLRKLYVEWMASGEPCFTPTGRIKRPSMELMCQWIGEAWDMISPKIVVRSFKKTGISNDLDGTEDDILWNDTDVVEDCEVVEDSDSSTDNES